MGNIITVGNRRGGTGKTFTTQTIGIGLHRKGYRVLLVDLDSQGNLSFDLGTCPNHDLDSLGVMLGERTAAETIQHTKSGIDLIPSSERLAAADLLLKDPDCLRDAIRPIRSAYDWILIDTAPSLGMLTVSALTASDQVLISAQAEIHSLQGASMLIDSVNAVRRERNPKLEILGILLTRYNPRTVISRDMRYNFEVMAERIGSKVFQTAIRECTAVKESQAMQTDIFTYSPKCNASIDYEQVIREIINR